jgi:hypothetical protein
MSLKHDAYVPTFRVTKWVTVVANVALLCGEDGVVAAYVAIFAGEPFGAALAVDDDAWDD